MNAARQHGWKPDALLLRGGLALLWWWQICAPWGVQPVQMQAAADPLARKCAAFGVIGLLGLAPAAQRRSKICS